MIPLVHTPAPAIEVRTGRDGRPLAFRWRRRWRNVASVEVNWHYTEGWWHEDPHQRAYYRLEARDGMRCIIYRDLLTGCWHLHQTLD